MIDMGYYTKISKVLHIGRKDTLFWIFYLNILLFEILFWNVENAGFVEFFYGKKVRF
jgi:hypothetical protein